LIRLAKNSGLLKKKSNKEAARKVKEREELERLHDGEKDLAARVEKHKAIIMAKLVEQNKQSMTDRLAIAMNGLVAAQSTESLDSVEEPTRSSECNMLLERARGSMKEKRYKEAFKIYEEVVLMSGETEDQDDELRILVTTECGVAAMYAGEVQFAIDHYNDALTLATKHDKRDVMSKILLNLASAYTEIGNDDLAATYIARCTSIGSTEVVRSASEIEAARVAAEALSFGYTPAAPTKSDVETLREMIFVEEDLSPRSFDEILDDAKSGDLDSLLDTLKGGGDNLRPLVRHQHTKLGVSALMLVAGLNRSDLVTLLLDLGADPNALDLRGHNALYWACKFGCSQTVELLFNRGCKFDASIGKGDIQSFNKDIVNIILKYATMKS
jgi:hypothetical protein